MGVFNEERKDLKQSTEMTVVVQLYSSWNGLKPFLFPEPEAVRYLSSPNMLMRAEDVSNFEASLQVAAGQEERNYCPETIAPLEPKSGGIWSVSKSRNQAISNKSSLPRLETHNL